MIYFSIHKQYLYIYVILQACKMVALLSNIGQKMNDAEIKNFFRFFNSQIPMTIQLSTLLFINRCVAAL